MECPDCGAVYSKEDLFCGECGRPLSTETPPGESSSSPRAEDQMTATHKPARRPPVAAPVTPQPRRSFSKLALTLGGVALVLLCFCVVGAGILFSILEESVTNPTGTVPAQGDLLYEDDFRDPGSGWDTWSEDATSGKYVDGEYRLAVYQEDYMAWSYPADDEEFADLAIEVEARQVEGSLDSTFGLLVRHQVDEERYYWFQISGDGYYSVEEMRDGEWILLQEWEPSDAIKQGLESTNRLRVVCYGDRFSFYVNETHLTDLVDDALRSGAIGLAAGAYAEPPVVVHFDNLSVYALED
jgi:hypothetical protein